MITKAIIPVAGFGTRRLPITKAIEKCMLPILNRPIIDYVVSDCIDAGIKEICIIVGEDSEQVRKYYSHNELLERYLDGKGKGDVVASISPPAGVHFTFITQPVDGRYGTSIPIEVAREFIGTDESVLICMGDDFLWNKDGSNEIKKFLDYTSGGAGIIGSSIAPDELEKYGVIEQDLDGNYIRIIEHPSPGTAPSSMINVSKYILNQGALRRVYEYCNVQRTGEYMIIDPINDYVNDGGKIKVYESKAVFMDGGTLEGWIDANNRLFEAQ